MEDCTRGRENRRFVIFAQPLLLMRRDQNVGLVADYRYEKEKIESHCTQGSAEGPCKLNCSFCEG